MSQLHCALYKIVETLTEKTLNRSFVLRQLYAKRKTIKGFSYSTDTYLQHELEASFMWEDTPDQTLSTIAIKEDMEKETPMDRLVCGDVGFGKTELAIRAAFKAVADNKQVAILVPTTILALQHYKTFRNRLKNFPCKVDYINRFKTTKQQNQTLKDLNEGKIDILIGTHRIIGKDVNFKDLGLLIIDEEQKFGVNIKDKLKNYKKNVDILTLSATPIPRTLQFSLLGARDLSIINTPPPNRIAIHTEIIGFNEETIRDAIQYEISRNGQIFFIHNRIENIKEISGILQRLVPNAKIKVGHGQMEGRILEERMIGFIEGDYDVLVSTTIVENGVDVPNANTILINNANHFGLSDLHQMRGRVGRSNKKAFCYLISPPYHQLSDDSRKRLQALDQFSNLGSGFSIAMRDLDIRGAGDLLGADQSGFINEIGFEMYQKILNESIEELKFTEPSGNKSLDGLETGKIILDISNIKGISQAELKKIVSGTGPFIFMWDRMRGDGFYKTPSGVRIPLQGGMSNSYLTYNMGAGIIGSSTSGGTIAEVVTARVRESNGYGIVGLMSPSGHGSNITFFKIYFRT